MATISQVTEASRLWKAGTSMKRIVEQTGMSMGSLTHYSNERRDLFPRRLMSSAEARSRASLACELVMSGMSVSDAARRLKVSRKSVYRVMSGEMGVANG